MWLRTRAGLSPGPRTAAGQLERAALFARDPAAQVLRFGDLLYTLDALGRARHVAVLLGAAQEGRVMVQDAPQSGRVVEVHARRLYEVDRVVPREVAWT